MTETTSALICTCDACRYTFNAALYHTKYSIPTRCPDCGKAVIHTGNSTTPAIRLATDVEIVEYYKTQREILEEITAALVKDDVTVGKTDSSTAVNISSDDALWQTLQVFENYTFHTAKGLPFHYTIKGGEIFFDRKEKSVTRATVMQAFHKAVEIQRRDGFVRGPKKLGTFGASYLYPIFLRIGVCRAAADPL